MLDILLVIIAILTGGACVVEGSRRLYGDDRWLQLGMRAFQQAFAARNFRPGAAPESSLSCRRAAVAVALDRPAPQRAACYATGPFAGRV
jgi:hypothetical protein